MGVLMADTYIAEMLVALERALQTPGVRGKRRRAFARFEALYG
jgi:hypothetical protein